MMRLIPTTNPPAPVWIDDTNNGCMLIYYDQALPAAVQVELIARVGRHMVTAQLAHA